MEILFLGTGTSTGVPQIGCECETCLSADPKDKRLRASVLITNNEDKILIDCGPDFRQQALSNRVNGISAVLLTHEHYDHIGGLDDIRPLGNVKIFAAETVLSVIRRNMPYCFQTEKYPGVPLIELHEIDETPFYIHHTEILPVRVMHANLPIFGFRIGTMAYLTDVKSIGQHEIDQLKNLDVLVLNALRPNKHFSHLSLNEAIELSDMIGAARTYFIHMSHDMGKHQEISQLLPENIQLAYDGLKINV